MSLKETGETRTDDDNDIIDDDASLETVKMTAADNHSDSRSDTVSDNVKTVSDNIEVINETLEKCRINESAKEMPFKIQYKEGVGNYVVATRDIKPNEVRSLIIRTDTMQMTSDRRNPLNPQLKIFLDNRLPQTPLIVMDSRTNLLLVRSSWRTLLQWLVPTMRRRRCVWSV